MEAKHVLRQQPQAEFQLCARLQEVTRARHELGQLLLVMLMIADTVATIVGQLTNQDNQGHSLHSMAGTPVQPLPYLEVESQHEHGLLLHPQPNGS